MTPDRGYSKFSPAKISSNEYKPSREISDEGGKTAKPFDREALGKDIKFMNKGWGVRGDNRSQKINGNQNNKAQSRSPFQRNDKKKPTNEKAFLTSEQQKDILHKSQKKKVPQLSITGVKDQGNNNNNNNTMKKKPSKISNYRGSAWIGGSNIDFGDFE